MILQEALADYHIILASQSPRRKMLLQGLDLDFEVIIRPDVNEEFPEGMGMKEIPVFLAEHKSVYYEDLLTGKNLIITADTIVWHNQSLVGKPADEEEAFQILRKLSGSSHEVVTGVCLRTGNKRKVFSSHSTVYFRRLSSPEIEYYIRQYKPLDKAGAYGIQEWIGYIGIEKIEGSFYNVMGLPVQMLYSELIHFVNDQE